MRAFSVLFATGESSGTDTQFCILQNSFCRSSCAFIFSHNKWCQSLLLPTLDSAALPEKLRPVPSFDCVIRLNKPWRQVAADPRDLVPVAGGNSSIHQKPHKEMNCVHTTRSSCYRRLLETQGTENRWKVACWSSWGKSQFLTEILLMSLGRVMALREVLRWQWGLFWNWSSK